MRPASASYDYVIVGSGFGGSVSALRLSQKGYRVLVVEKGRRFETKDISKGTTRPGAWIWDPKIGLNGIMKLTFLKHVGVMSGVGVGGGSLVYGATLPTPKDSFFQTGSWAGLNNWKDALEPHYQTALSMLGATKNPRLTAADFVLRDLAREVGREDTFEATNVGIFFGDDGEAGQEVADPYFDGKGPKRTGCIQCGDCMTGCPYGAKNSLDKNYLYLAEKLGAEVLPETEVLDVKPAGARDGSEGYFIKAQFGKEKPQIVKANGVIMAGGVMGTVPLLLKLRDAGSLPRLSEKLGKDVRTNNESLTSVTAVGKDPKFNDGVAIGSIFHPDEHSHVEPIRLGAKSGLWRLMLLPMATGGSLIARLGSLFKNWITDPIRGTKAIFTSSFGPRTICLLFMQHLDSSLSIERGRFGRLQSKLEPGQLPPSADIPLSNKLAHLTEKIIGGKASRLGVEILRGAPATAHILGGAVMGKDETTGVIDAENHVFNYRNLFVCDGSAISANPGVNPSLSITAITEHAMSKIPHKSVGKE
ncbi:GMC oxidoreductase [Kordiimonas sp. SCSIO 12610]|uniref:GMC oxidoreductase n=1 Tax=Kordiimonas sp. SCSIO 12610 TaxID=2829597 RepID=UPI00210EE41B|nr:GMC family oxidoreductase [Kordiimonas sp. SCSIO 12610]UTW56511.1 GMC family oxidoreductase [Kordiimonas sp. SCSIO 12610]